jgi:hypothetical protein
MWTCIIQMTLKFGCTIDKFRVTKIKLKQAIGFHHRLESPDPCSAPVSTCTWLWTERTRHVVLYERRLIKRQRTANRRPSIAILRTGACVPVYNRAHERLWGLLPSHLPTQRNSIGSILVQASGAPSPEFTFRRAAGRARRTAELEHEQKSDAATGPNCGLRTLPPLVVGHHRGVTPSSPLDTVCSGSGSATRPRFCRAGSRSGGDGGEEARALLGPPGFRAGQSWVIKV